MPLPGNKVLIQAQSSKTLWVKASQKTLWVEAPQTTSPLPGNKVLTQAHPTTPLPGTPSYAVIPLNVSMTLTINLNPNKFIYVKEHNKTAQVITHKTPNVLLPLKPFPCPRLPTPEQPTGRESYGKHAVHIARQKYAIYIREYTIYRNKYIATLRTAFQDIRSETTQRKEGTHSPPTALVQSKFSTKLTQQIYNQLDNKRSPL